MDLLDLDSRINEAGQLPTAINNAVVELIAKGHPYSLFADVLKPLMQLSGALARIQDWSNAAKIVGVQPKTVISRTEVTDYIEAHKDDKLPELSGDLRTRLLREVLHGQHDATLDADLGANHNAYINAYGVGGYYYHPDNFRGL